MLRGKGRGWGLELALLLLALQAAAVMACAPRTRHAVLAFLVDGVPPYMTPEERVLAEAEAARQEAEQKQVAEQRRNRRYQPVRKLSRFVHGPYAAKECGRCHDLGAASGFRGSRGGGALGPESGADLAEAGRLRMPVVDLCVHCHDDFRAAPALARGAWVHGPVASGWCVLCHEPHSASYPKLLHADPTARLCGQCHQREDLVAFTPEHRPSDPESAWPPVQAAGDEAGDADEEAGEERPEVVRVVRDCTRCHDPHRGADRMLLRAGGPADGAAPSAPEQPVESPAGEDDLRNPVPGWDEGGKRTARLGRR